MQTLAEIPSSHQVCWQTLFEDRHLATLVCTPSGTIANANLAAHTLWGGADTLIGSELTRWLPDLAAVGQRPVAVTLQRPDRRTRRCEISVQRATLADGSWQLITLSDRSARIRARQQDVSYKALLELLARDAPLHDTLLAVVRSVEKWNSSMRVSILLLDATGSHLLLGAAPSLPDFYNQAIDGVAIGDGVGSCGTAAFRGERVVVENIQLHPYWAGFRTLAARAGLAACWSEPIRGASGKILGTLAIYHAQPTHPSGEDIDSIAQAARLASIAIERSRASEARILAALITQHSSEAMLVMNTERKVRSVNPAFTQLTGYRQEDIANLQVSLLRSPRNATGLFEHVYQTLSLHDHWQGEVWHRRKDGSDYPARLSLSSIRGEDGELSGYVGLFSDITQQKAAEEQVWHQANFDPLTGLPNRRHFLDQLVQQMQAARQNGHTLALIYLDLDRFKEVNDTLGHSAGDTLLVEISHRLLDCVRGGDSVARLGGDEFTIVVTEQPGQHGAEALAQRVLARLSEPLQQDGEVWHVSASLGITRFPDNGSSIEDLLRQADQAMYAAKQQGRNRWCHFTSDMQQVAQQRMQLLRELRVALSRQEMHLEYQPIVSLRSGQIVKAEALLRWRHPQQGMISPALFIPLAEETGLIVEIGSWVLDEVERQASAWQQRFGRTLQISVNVSPVQFDAREQPLDDWIGRLIASEHDITIEITESLLLDASSPTQQQLLQLRDAGIQVAIDDFGTGYSSLSYLKKFDIDYLKIDQSFVRNLQAGNNDLALCEAIIVMAHALGLEVIAEGVETDAQRALLTQAGCDYAQGYLFSRPLPPEAFSALAFTASESAGATSSAPCPSASR